MANPTTAAEWQESKDALVTQRADLATQEGRLLAQTRDLEFRAALTAEQLRKAPDPVQRAQLRSQYESITFQLQQTNNQITQNLASQATLKFQIDNASEKILLAGSGTPNTNTATEPANNNPGSNTQAAPEEPLITPAVKSSVPPQLRVEASVIGPDQVTYDVIDVERGTIIQSLDTQAEANTYMAQVGAGATPTSTSESIQNNSPANPELVPGGGSSIPYDELGNLNPGWEQDELGNPYYVGTDIVPKSAPTPVTGPTGTPYDDDGNLNIGWGLNENGDPVWVGAGYIDATGETIQAQKTPSNIQGPPYDDEGNLMPGWSLDEDNNPVWVGNNADGSVFVEPATQASADASRAAAQGLTAKKLDTNSQATQQDVSNFQQKEDWRVRLSLAPSADYLYKVPKGSAGILEPLQATDGVIFPYTPQIQVNYQANYDPTDLTHSNYKIFQYRNSGVDAVTITCDFTAQDTYEANYLLAVIHFFRSVTKMFYGQDQNPKPGTPPPLCYLTGLGAFQFDAHPLAITSFNYSLPSDVDYIRAGAVTAGAGVNRSPSNTVNNSQNVSSARLGPGIGVGGTGAGPIFSTPPGTVDPTYVPTKIQLSIGAVPVVTRNDISNKFSLKEYATGSLLRGTRRQGGGIW